MNSTQQVAIITGASRGIGKAVAVDLFKQGYTVALLARTEKTLQELKHRLLKTANPNQQVLIYPIDITQQQQVNKAINNIIAKTNRIDVLFNSAGISIHGTSNTTPEAFTDLINVNILGTYYPIYAVTPQMKKQSSGYIINMSSNSGKLALPRLGSYAMTKFALMGYSEALFKELAEYNIKVTALCPSVTDTDMTRYYTNINAEEKITTNDIVKTINYLLSLGNNACVPEVVIKCKKLIAAPS